jgi:hypothetical protein
MAGGLERHRGVAQSWARMGAIISLSPHGLSDRAGLFAESRVEPNDDGSDDDHCSVIRRSLLIAGRQPTPLLQAVDAALDHVATGVDRLVNDEWTTRSSRPLRALVAPLWNGVLDLPPAQQAPTAGIAIAFISDEVIWAGAWSPAPCGVWDPDAVQHGSQLGTIMTLSWGNDDGEGPPAAVTGEMELGRQPSTAAPEPLIGRVLDPLVYLVPTWCATLGVAGDGLGAPRRR